MQTNVPLQVWERNPIHANAAGDLAHWCSRKTHLAEDSGLLPPALKNVKKVKQKLL